MFVFGASCSRLIAEFVCMSADIITALVHHLRKENVYSSNKIPEQMLPSLSIQMLLSSLLLAMCNLGRPSKLMDGWSVNKYLQ